MRKLLVVVTTLTMLLSLTAGTAFAAKPKAPPATPDSMPVDDMPHPLGSEQSALRAQGLQGYLSGHLDKHGHNGVVQVRRGKFVELDRQGEDTIWTVLGQFGDTVHPSYGGTTGPVHNQIPAPDRSVDNTSIWASDFNQAYYTSLLFSNKKNAVSMRDFYLEQSSGRYTVNGTVEDWVTVPYNEARYGTNACGDIVCSTVWRFVQDEVNAWYAGQVAAGKTPAEIAAYLSQFDKWDRYDYDGDGNFNEPDGYIDHFQAIHAGSGEETGGGAQGEDAIWSHRWYAFYNLIGSAGPAGNLLGGVKIGDSNVWIGDYTVEPEDGGVGVFSHEFGHDLGLPDLYDTSGNTGGAENSTGFWTLYSSGSYGSSGKPKDGIGTEPVHMSAYEKLFLGWSNYEIVGYGAPKTRVHMGPAEYNTTKTQQLVVTLPPKEVTTDIGAPHSGTHQYYSGSGNNLDNSMTRSVTLPAGTVSLDAFINYDIETGYDYLYLTVNGTPVHTNLSDPGFNEGITDTSGGVYVPLHADLSAYAGQTVSLAFEYITDGGVAPKGALIDDIAITGNPTDGAEAGAPAWTFDGFANVTQSITQAYENYYIAENRVYWGYDQSLKTGPYNFGFLDNPALGNWVEHFPYQNGLLVWYLDYSHPDNNVGDYCLAGNCGGFFLPVDAHPNLLIRPDGKVWRPRIQSYDSTFGLQKTDKITLHLNSVAKTYGGLPANPVFDDSVSYWVAPNAAIGNFGWSSVPVPNTGTTIRVLAQQGNWMTVEVKFKH